MPPFQITIKSLILSVAAALTLIGCSKKEDKTIYYQVSFYDSNLDFNGSLRVKANETIDLPSLIEKLNLSPNLYQTNDSNDSVNDQAYNITKNTNFYAIQGVTEITDQAGLAAINASPAALRGKYILLNDIALDDSKDGFDATEGWMPIGNALRDNTNFSFSGVFNGNDHKITGLWIDRNSSIDIGLFGRIEGAQIKNLGVEIANGKAIKGGTYVGAIAGKIKNGSITNGYAMGNISGIDYIGGIAGYVWGESSVINSRTAGNISGIDYIGGIAGYVIGSSTITNSYATGNVDGRYYVGGIAGSAWSAYITNSYATGNIGGYAQIGGVVGYAVIASVTNSYASGSVNGKGNVGGVAGAINGGTKIERSVAINPSITGNDNIDRVVGKIAESDYKALNNFALSSAAITPKGGIGSAGTLKDEAALKKRSTYESLGWVFGTSDSAPWQIDPNKNNGYPYLYWQDR